MLFGCDAFFAGLLENRTVYIGGWKGEGKTLLSIEIAEHFLKQGYKMVSNLSCVWNEDYYSDDITLDDNVLGIVDEGGIYTRSYSTVSSFTEFSRKTRSIVIFVGRREPHEELCDFVVYPFWDLQKNLLIPLKIWRWEVYQRKKTYNGFILQTGWQKYYGLYSSIDPGDYPINLLAFFETRAKKLFELYGRKYQISDLAVNSNTTGQNLINDNSRDMAIMANKIRAELSLSKGKSTGRLRR